MIHGRYRIAEPSLTLFHGISCRPSITDAEEQEECKLRYEKGYIWFCWENDVECNDMYTGYGPIVKVVLREAVLLYDLSHLLCDGELRHHIERVDSTAMLGHRGWLPEPDGLDVEDAKELLLDSAGRAFYGYTAAFCASVLRVALERCYPDESFSGWRHDKGSAYGYITLEDGQEVEDDTFPSEVLLWNFWLSGEYRLRSRCRQLQGNLSDLPVVMRAECERVFAELIE